MDDFFELEHCKTMSVRDVIYQDLWSIRPRWMEWYLRSAVSAQGRLLTQVKALDPLAFFLNYAWNIARKLPLGLFK